MKYLERIIIEPKMITTLSYAVDIAIRTAKNMHNIVNQVIFRKDDVDVEIKEGDTPEMLYSKYIGKRKEVRDEQHRINTDTVTDNQR